MVTVVTMFPGAAAVSKTPSPSSRPSQGARPNVKGTCLRVEIAARQYNPYPLTSDCGTHLPGGEKAGAFSPCPTASVKFRRGAGCPFQRAALLGSRPQTAGQSPIPPRRAQGTFDAKCQKCFCVTFAESNKGRRLWRRKDGILIL